MSTSTHTNSTHPSSTTSAKTGGQDKLAALHEQISDGVAALVESEGWRAMLDTAAKFHSYSLGNLLLIALQAPQATRVAGFRSWQGLGRQVRKGERGIAILAPCTYRPKTADQAEPIAPAGPEPATFGGGVVPDAGGKQVRGFRVVHVFALHQTEGAPLPDVAPALLTGQAPAGLWDDLASQVTGYGYALERGECAGANGYTDPTRRVVRVRDDIDEAQAVKVLAHELGHLECGHVTDLPTYLTCRGRCEVEAESVAYVVTAAHGLDASGYTFAYVAGWAGGDLICVRQAAETVTKAARTILGRCSANTATGSDVLADTA
jgi:antirestriction protein ArdC